MYNSVNSTIGNFTFNSHKWHNPSCDIVELKIDDDTFITYGVYVKDVETQLHSKIKREGTQFMEYYSGPNYNLNSKKSRNYSRAYGLDNAPKWMQSELPKMKKMLTHFQENS